MCYIKIKNKTHISLHFADVKGSIGRANFDRKTDQKQHINDRSGEAQEQLVETQLGLAGELNLV